MVRDSGSAVDKYATINSLGDRLLPHSFFYSSIERQVKSEQRHLVFLGAGASAPLGIPAMTPMVEEFASAFRFSDYLQCIKTLSAASREFPRVRSEFDFLHDERRKILRQIEAKMEDIQNCSRLPNFKKLCLLWSLVQTASEKQHCDIEDVLVRLIAIDASLIPMRLRLEDEVDPIYFDTFVGAFDSRADAAERRAIFTETIRQHGATLTDYILSFIKQRCTCKLDETRLARVFGPLFGALETRSAPFDVVTTNYDKAIEIFLHHSSLSFDDGVSKQGRFNPAALSMSSEAIRLLKLHGSVDLYDNSTEIIQLASPDIRQLVDGTTVAEVMMYPGRPKESSSGVFHELFSVFRHWLRSTRHCMIVGYSFRDEKIRNLFSAALEEDELLTMAIMSPDCKSTIDHYFAPFKDRIRPISRKLEDATPDDWDAMSSLSPSF
jgi:hypothetical protein